MKTNFQSGKKTIMYACTVAILVITSINTHAEHPKEKLSGQLNDALESYFEIENIAGTLTHIIYNGKSDQEIIKLSRSTVTSEFKDPDSAKFRNERVVRLKFDAKDSDTQEDGVFICGEVNGKNSYGAYVGYRDYVASALRVVIESKENEFLFWTILHYCSNKS